MSQLVKLEEWLKRVRNGILNKLLIKISSISQEGYSQQLVEIEKRIKKLWNSLPSEEEIERIANLAKTAKAIPKKDLREISEFVNKISKDDIDVEKITTLAESTKEFKERDAKAISKFIKKFSKEELEKTAILAETERAIQEKDANAIFKFLKETPKKKLEKMAILAGAARAVQELDEIKIFPEKAVNFDKYIEFQEILTRLEGLRKLSEQGNIPPSDEIKRIKEELDGTSLWRIAKLVAEFERIGSGKTIPLNEEALRQGERALLLERIKSTSMHEGENREHEGERREIYEEIRKSYQEGVKLLKEGKNEEAYNRFDEIIKNNPNLKGAWVNKGIAAGRLGRRGEAIYCYTVALRIDRGYEKASHNLQLIS